jgi:predicted ATPase
MPSEQQRVFSPFRLDPANAQLWRGEEEITLRRKTFEVLRYLVDHPGQLVTKAALLDAVWAEFAVSDTMPAICVGELRKAMGDDPQTPRFIETVHGRGYRFIAKVMAMAISPAQTKRQAAPPSTAPIMVGREEELVQLQAWFAKASAGTRQIVFVSGEPGIGKTTLVRAFLDSIAGDGGARIGRGQCVEQYGSGEPFMPLLEALTRLGQEPEGEQLLEILRRIAPTWLAQMPSLLTADDRARLQSEMPGATRQRMLREMTEALDALAIEAPLILLLEDLHWSDFSTLELISAIARRPEPARLLILGAYRPVAMLANDHPLRTMKEELELHRQCDELRLKSLTEAHVADYLDRRFSGRDTEHSFSVIAPAIHARTEGNPLFMVNVVDYLVSDGPLLDASKIETPRSILQMIERNLDRLSPDEQSILQSASVVGAEFSAATVAAALEQPANQIEESCVDLVRREQFLAAAADHAWPDGTVAARFCFRHSLYRDVLYERVPAGRRVELHRRVAERQEVGWADRAAEIAAELAHHFDRANDKAKALKYFQLAGGQAVKRSANTEAVSHLTKALEMLKTLPESPSRAQQELVLQITLGVPLMLTKGYGAPEVEKVYSRARELSQQVGESPQFFPILFGLWAFYSLRAEYSTARELGEQLVSMAQSAGDSALLIEAHTLRGNTLCFLGELVLARGHLEQAIALYDPQQHRSHAFVYGQDPGVHSLSYATLALWLLGYPDQARKKSIEALALAQELSHPYSLAFALIHVLYIHRFSYELKATQERAEEVSALSTEHGFPITLAAGAAHQGWALAEQGREKEGIMRIRQGIDTWRATGSTLFFQPFLLAMLAEVHGKGGLPEEGLTVLDEALAIVDKTGERFWEAELYRLKGELTVQAEVQGSRFKVQAEAEKCFRTAIDIARRQSAKSLELRAGMSLSRLWRRRGKKAQARQMLAEIYNWFTEGFDTADLKEAKALLKDASRE